MGREKLYRGSLRRKDGVRSFEHGVGYLKRGNMRALGEGKGTITAKVTGTRLSRVKLRIGNTLLDSRCSMGQDGPFFKHAVARVLAWPDQSLAARSKGKTSRRGAGATLDDVCAWLAAQDRADLVSILMEQAMDHDRLRRRFLIHIAKKNSQGPDFDTYKNAIDQQVDVGGGDERDIFDYAAGIEEALEPIEELLKQRRSSEAMEGIMGSVDESHGHIDGLAERLQDIHLKACRKAHPDPEVLARQIFAWELHGNWGAYHGAAKIYKDILGKNELAGSEGNPFERSLHGER